MNLKFFFGTVITLFVLITLIVVTAMIAVVLLGRL